MAETSTAASSRAHRSASRARPSSLIGIGVVTLLALLVVFAAPYVLDTYSINVLMRSLLYAAVALTVDLLWGYMGILTFGQSAFFAAGAYAAGLVFTHIGFSSGNAVLALGIAIVGSAVMALGVGALAFWHGATALYASVITLVLTIVATQVLFSGGTFTGSSSGLSGFGTFAWSVEAWFWIVGSFLVLVTAAAWIYVRSDAGRLLVAIRENEHRCKYLGINTSRIKQMTFMVCGIIGAVAGFLYASYTVVVAPELAGFVFGTELVIWTALGGRGTLLGPVFGTILIDYESAQLQGEYPFIWKLVIGIVFVVVIIALPRGFLPLITGPWRAMRRRFSTAGAAGQAGKAAMHLVPKRGEARHSATDATEAAGPALEVAGVEKFFGSLKVLTGIDFTARAGELVSLVGPNGAGKTTLMRCIADGSERSGGTIKLNGHSIGARPPEGCVALGVGRKFQMANVFDALTVGECLQIARARLDRPSYWRRSELLALPESALHVIRTTGLEADLGQPASLLSHGKKQALELAMVLALEPHVLLLDEPTAGLTKSERTLIGRILIDLALHQRLCILLVEHDLDFVREISSRVIVLHQGRIVLDGSVEEVVNSDVVKAVYAGSAHK